MGKRSAPRLVIDASVAARAGKVGETPSAKACRDFLICLRENSYRIAFSEELREEWKKHASPFAERWRAQMVGKKGRIEFHTPDFPELQDFVVDMQITKKKRDKILKDCHLVELALATDRRVVSLDETARNDFRRIAASVEQLQKVVWVNAELEDEEPIKWLESGANEDRIRTLGYDPDEE